MTDPSALEIYEAHLRNITDVCADPWFAGQLARCRSGDEVAKRRISASCLGQVLAIAKEHWRHESPASLLEVVQEGNAALWEAIRQVRDNTADEFLREMRLAVERRVILFLQHPR
jgi:hypothetical protein